MKTEFQPLFEPYEFKKGIRLKNRIVMAPMTTISGNEDGTVSDSELAYYERRSGGVGMIITACTYVTRNGKGFPGEFGGDIDELIPSMSKLAAAIKEKGAKAVLQIFHGGRLCPPALVPGGDIVSASAVASEQNGGVVPRALTEAEVEAIIRDFGETTRRAIEAGYDGIELHGANGYLLQQFFSPHSNRREDEWGGSLEKRMKFPLAVLDEVKRVAAEHTANPFLIGYRLSPEEAETPGITMEETFRLVDALTDRGLDYIHVSTNEFWSKPRRGADESKSRIEWIQERVGGRVPVIGVGSIHTPNEALEALNTGIALVALGREIVIEPDWVEKTAEGSEDQIKTTLSKNPIGKEELTIPDPMWNMIVNTPGWFPIGD
ncbi:NADH-dependent flavin oxidoreductase [Paenibacillus sp. NEAU-GSW1]|uniref:NADH-dependent flavin oxidoreductase n=1 Tax=Paenibacillus sp. NEAU-GSW1 TaxID=2682486 RepID=UPI0012E20635|nr:NADH-dependent flavin oxidoreductase [Paenibacillus sp. NEAU-GSW1]MUT67489.1 NADH-dependent flavin oxidoreductase [Paenibacillus sp. NEAU-GSW1]